MAPRIWSVYEADMRPEVEICTAAVNIWSFRLQHAITNER
jgi:hypothetical protein